jgi:hypothetical protein
MSGARCPVLPLPEASCRAARRRATPPLALIALLLACAPDRAAAKDVAIGWQTTRMEFHVDTPVAVPGFHVAVAIPRSDHFNLVFEFDRGTYTDDANGGELGTTEDHTVYTYAAGIRLSGARGQTRLMPFGELLAGGIGDRSTFTIRWAYGSFSDSASSSVGMLQLGGGLAVLLTRRVAVFARGDYQVMIGSDGSDAATRVAAGARFWFK